MDSDSDMSQKMMIFLPDCDDFVAESSSEAVLDEPVYFCVKKVWKVCLLTSPHFYCGCFFVTKTRSHSITHRKQTTLESVPSTCSFITIHLQTNTQCFSECDYPVCLQTSLGSLRLAVLQHPGTEVQKGLLPCPVHVC